MKILTIIGARPQFIKASVVSRALQATSGFEEIIVHTGQHFDANMSEIFFTQLAIPKPDYQLDIHGGGHGEMTGKMLMKIESVIKDIRPDRVLVYGDTNSTLAGALAAVKLHVPLAHVEAGLRSFNMHMPEEVNRILTDQISDLLFCPTETAVRNLTNEGFAVKDGISILKVGDVMQDAALLFAEKAEKGESFRSIPDGHFVLATLHRAENTDDPNRLRSIITALNIIHCQQMPVILPLHPRTKAVIASLNLSLEMIVIDPVGYLEMLWLLQHTSLVVTDSGGVQKEAFFFAKPCVTMRDQTEWVELVDAGVNVLVGANQFKIVYEAARMVNVHVEDKNQIYGGGYASQRIVRILQERNR